MTTPVLVTGGSGFLGLHTIIQLLERGYARPHHGPLARRARPRCARRSPTPASTPAIGSRSSSPTCSPTTAGRQAVDGAEYVLHVASPLPGRRARPRRRPDRPGARGHAARAARRARRRRPARRRDVVVRRRRATAASQSDHVFTEADWTDPGADIGAYIKSKTDRRARRVGLHRPRRRRSRARGRQPGRHLRPGARRRPLGVDRPGLRTARRRDGRRDAAPGVLGRRRPRRRGPAPARHGRSRRPPGERFIAAAGAGDLARRRRPASCANASATPPRTSRPTRSPTTSCAPPR